MKQLVTKLQSEGVTQVDYFEMCDVNVTLKRVPSLKRGQEKKQERLRAFQIFMEVYGKTIQRLGLDFDQEAIPILQKYCGALKQVDLLDAGTVKAYQSALQHVTIGKCRRSIGSNIFVLASLIYLGYPRNYNATIHAADCKKMTEETRLPNWEALQEPHEYLQIAEVWKRTLGEGIRVAVLDTGVDVNHPLLARRVVAMKSFVPNEHAFIDYDGHGTHCAGVILAEPFIIDNQLLRVGIAPLAKLLVCKVLDKDGNGENAWLCEGKINIKS